jgi:hypothetical protein
MPGGEIQSHIQADEMTEERKFVILFAATILVLCSIACARVKS